MLDRRIPFLGLLTLCPGPTAAQYPFCYLPLPTRRPRGRTSGGTRRRVRLERWLMRSCDALTTYLALLVPTPGGGTDVVVRRLEAPASGP